MPQLARRIRKARVLFLCTGNSCRSQMAEGWARFLHSGCVEALSAGTHPKGVDPLAVRAMAEAGVDISGHVSKPLAPSWFEDGPERLDLVVTVCDSAAAACPVPPAGVRTLHAPFDDPPALAAGCENERDCLAHYARVRDEIRRFIEELPELLDRPGTPPKAG